MKERNHGSLRSFSTSRFMKGKTLGGSNSSALSLARASPIIHQRILKGKWQTPFKYTKCTPESVNVNIIILGAALSRNDVTFPGERVLSQQKFRKSDKVGVNSRPKVTSFLDGPLLRPRAKNGGFQLVLYIPIEFSNKNFLEGSLVRFTLSAYVM